MLLNADSKGLYGIERALCGRKTINPFKFRILFLKAYMGWEARSLEDSVLEDHKIY